MKKMILTILAASMMTAAFAKAPVKDASVVASATSIDNAVRLEWAQSGTVEVKMITARGQVVKSISRMTIAAGASSSISLQDLSSGVYYVTINTGRSIQKIAVTK